MLLHPAVGQFGSPSSLLIIALWSVGLVPLSFVFWFRSSRAREQEAAQRALTTWQQGLPGAGAEVARALELVIAEEDEAALKRFLQLFSRTPPPLPPAVKPFLLAAKAWLGDQGGLASREEHLDRVRDALLQLGPELSEVPRG